MLFSVVKQGRLPDTSQHGPGGCAGASNDAAPRTARPSSIHEIAFPPNHVLDQLAMPDVHDMGFLDDVPSSAAQQASALAALVGPSAHVLDEAICCLNMAIRIF